MDIRKSATEIAKTLGGLSYVLVMKEGEQANNVSFHPRENQPCWGEMRKYQSTHPTECTQPANGKPGDLHYPFPDGKPVAFATMFGQKGNMAPDKNQNRCMEAMLDPVQTIYGPGLGKVEMIKDDKGNFQGIYLPHLYIDPTVLVFFLRRRGQFLAGQANYICEYVDAGLTFRQAFALHTANGGNHLLHGYLKNAFSPSLLRLLENNPQDLTGGLMSDRVDYNRTQLDEVWRHGDIEVPNVTWEQVAAKLKIPQYGYGGGPLNIKDTIPLIKEEFEKLVSPEEKVTTRPLFVWKLNEKCKMKQKGLVAA